MRLNYKYTAFIVDDDSDDRESIRDAFLENKHEQNYIFMESGDRLMDHLYSSEARDYPSLILLDLNMPGKNGREALKEIKSNSQLKHIPVVIMTTSSSSRDRILSYELGANCFITKPDTYKKLVDITGSIAMLWLVD